MNNRLHIEVIASVNNCIGELSFMYLNDSDNLVGVIYINKKGLIMVQIIDKRYKSVILTDSLRICGDNIDNNTLCNLNEYPLRWKKALQFIDENKLDIIYSEDLKMDYEKPNKTYKYIKKI